MMAHADLVLAAVEPGAGADRDIARLSALAACPAALACIFPLPDGNKTGLAAAVAAIRREGGRALVPLNHPGDFIQAFEQGSTVMATRHESAAAREAMLLWSGIREIMNRN